MHFTICGDNRQPVWFQAQHVHIFNRLLHYVKKGIPVFSEFLDMSEAFDRTNHNLLFAELIKCNVPMITGC